MFPAWIDFDNREENREERYSHPNHQQVRKCKCKSLTYTVTIVQPQPNSHASNNESNDHDRGKNYSIERSTIVVTWIDP